MSPEELDGDLPLVCARTGGPAEALTPVWFTRSPWWAWVPLAVLGLAALVSGSWDPLATWLVIGALVVPLVLSRGVTGRLPLGRDVRRRMGQLRDRRVRTLLTALLATWLAVGLWLLGARAAGLIVLAAVLGLYGTAIAMAFYGRSLGVRGRPLPDGSVALVGVHPDFVDAVELWRTGHRP